METETKEAETIQTDEQKEDLPPDEVGKGGVFNLALLQSEGKKVEA
jgi:hypothetical protein